MSLVSLEDYEEHAARKLPKGVFDYYRGGACDELTIRLNRTAFDRIRIRPRVLRDVTTRDLSCQILGQTFSMPIGIAPTAFQRMAHPDGEVANAKAAGGAGIPFILSTAANTSIEEIGTDAPDTTKWFQMFVMRRPEVTKSFVTRAESAGFTAIVLTLDGQAIGVRRRDMRNNFTLPTSLRWANLEQYIEQLGGTGASFNIAQFVTDQYSPKLTWENVKWLKKVAKIPIILKGILTAEDALLAVDHGVEAIVVSNHGGRHLDSTPSPIEALPAIARAVGDRVTIILDSGVRQGTDVFKALALGAKMVLIGRPAIWGLAVNGQQGVEDVLRILRKELDVAMSLTGCKSLADITRNMVAHENDYCKL